MDKLVMVAHVKVLIPTDRPKGRL